MRSIVPKLSWALQDVLVINPLQQDLAPFHWLTAWHPVLPQHHMVNLLEFRFFPAWHRVLQHWLSSQPDFDEVTRWYLGWKVSWHGMVWKVKATLVCQQRSVSKQVSFKTQNMCPLAVFPLSCKGVTRFFLFSISLHRSSGLFQRSSIISDIPVCVYRACSRKIW